MSFKGIINFQLSLASLKKLTVFWIAVALAVSYVSQIRYDTWRRYLSPKVKVDYNIYIEPQPLSAETLKLVNFGARELIANWYWLTLIQYYGGGDPYGKYRKLAELFNTITELSPKFVAAYQTALLILPGEGFIDEALELSKRGKANLPDSWEIPYYTGLVHHIYRKDYVAAAREFEEAAAKTAAPPLTRYMAAVYYTQADQYQVAYNLFKVIYETTTDEFVKERSSKYLAHLEILFALQQASDDFLLRLGRYPKNLEELVTERIIKEIPVSPIGVRFSVDVATGKVGEIRK